MRSQLIVALDFHSEIQAFNLVHKLNPKDCALKVGNEMFTGLGPQFVKQLTDLGFKVFLDLKFHDIPNTVARACAVAAEMGVWMINVHASGGLAMMLAAQNALASFGEAKPLLIAVTVLTSMNANQLPEIGIESPLSLQVKRLAELAHQAQLDGIVCSALEVPIVKNLCGKNFLTVTPGIRLPGDSPDDQSRIVTPKEAAALGSDYLVMGRSITSADEPDKVIRSILHDLG